MAPYVTKAPSNTVESSEMEKKDQTAWKQPKRGPRATTEGEHLLSAKRTGRNESIFSYFSFLKEVGSLCTS